MCRNVVCLDCKKQFASQAKRGPIPKRCEACRRAVDTLRSKTNNRKKANAGHLRVCVHCNKQWLARHPKSKFCSRSCQHLASGGRVIVTCEQCHQPFNTTLKRRKEGHRFCGKACMRQARQPGLRSCVECGKHFRRSPKGANGKNDKALFCSKPCYFAARNAGRVSWDRTSQLKATWHKLGPYSSAPSVMALRHIAKCWKHVFKCHNLLTKMAALSASQRKCEVCGNACKNRSSRFCSYACKNKWRGERRCKCGQVVLGATACSRPYCDACKREARRRQKRMYGDYRKRCRTYGGHFNASVHPKAVFARDDWRCHICGTKTSKAFSVDDPLSATVDHHPVPLSKGGDHDWHNVRCACFKCNTLKGNKWDRQRRLALPG